MEIGVRLPHTGPQATPEFIRDWCVTADQAGFGSLWAVDHMVMPQHTESLYTLNRELTPIRDDAVSGLLAPNFEMMMSLAYVAAITSRIKLGTGVAVLTIRNAILNARQLATVDRYSGGRLLYGVGVGWLKEEAEAMNMPWDRRGARADEHIALLRALWTAPGERVEFHGEFWDVPPMDPEPRPVQQPIPILIGGHSEPAINRAARLGDGWIASSMSAGRLAELLPQVHAALDQHGRARDALTIYCSGGGRDGLPSVDDLRPYEELGVHSLSVTIRTLDDLKRFGDEVLPALV